MLLRAPLLQVGDLKHGRTVHSLAQLLSLYDVQLNYVAPEQLQFPAELEAELEEKGLTRAPSWKENSAPYGAPCGRHCANTLQ